MVGIALVSVLTDKCNLGFSASLENRNKKVLSANNDGSVAIECKIIHVILTMGIGFNQ